MSGCKVESEEILYLNAKKVSPGTNQAMLLYNIVPSKHPWVLVIYGPKLGGGAHTEKPSERTREPQSPNHRIIKNEGWAFSVMYGQEHYALLLRRSGPYAVSQYITFVLNALMRTKTPLLPHPPPVP